MTSLLGRGKRAIDPQITAEPDFLANDVGEFILLDGVEERLAAADPDLIVQLLQRAYRLKLLPLSFNALWLKYDVPKQRDRHSFGLALVQRSKGRKKLPPYPYRPMINEKKMGLIRKGCLQDDPLTEPLDLLKR
jgi:hypothetical protein